MKLQKFQGERVLCHLQDGRFERIQENIPKKITA